MTRILNSFLLLLVANCYIVTKCMDNDFDKLPLIPNSLPILQVDATYTKLIPRKIWMAVKEIKDELPGHLKYFFERNPYWEKNICDNKCKDRFMEEIFGGAKMSWVYNIMGLSVSKADIWRYCVLLYRLDRSGRTALCSLDHPGYTSEYGRKASYMMTMSDRLQLWELPVFPSNPPRRLGNQSLDKLIPRHLWVAVRDYKSGMNYQMPALFERNKRWDIHVEDNERKDKFMNSVFANTSLLWAYSMISPAAGAAKADIWRYAVLWTYGGAYVDDDSDMMSPLDSMIQPLDSMVISYERNEFNADVCYIPQYHLSDLYTYHKDNDLRKQKVFHSCTIPNWAMISAPRHPFITRTLENIVEIIKREYHRDSVLRSLSGAHRWMAIMCATGPSVLTASSREVIFSKKYRDLSYKLVGVDFREYGGRFKAVYTKVKEDPNHYMNKFQNKRKTTHLLSSYLPEKPVSSEELKEWDKTPIQGQNAKEIFVIDGGKKRGIPNWDTFVALNFSMVDVRVLSDTRVNGIPAGDLMPNLSKR